MAIYMKIAGIQGSVSAKSYEGSIEVLHYYLEAKRGVSLHTGVAQSRTTGTLQHSSLVLTKLLDKSSPALLQHFYKTESIPKIELQHVTTGSKLQCYLVNTFFDVLVSGMSESNSSEHAVEELTLHFLRHEKRFIPLGQTHNSTAPQSVGFDLAKVEVI